MKLKAGDLNGLAMSLGRFDTKSLPIKLSYAIARNKKAIIAELETLDSQRKKIFEQKCIKDENNNPIPDENNKYQFESKEDEIKAYTEYEELANTKIEININTVNFSDLEKCDDNGYDVMTVNDLEVLEFMITE